VKKVSNKVSVETLCELFGKSKQGFYKKERQLYKKQSEQIIVLQAVLRIRKRMPRIGVRKLVVKLLEIRLVIGRDALFELMDYHHLLVRRKRTSVRTTNSFHMFSKHPNLIRGIPITGPGQLWVSDITYIETDKGFAYLFLITDAYSRKIIGFKTADSLEAKHAVEALQMALKGLDGPTHKLIHHSDRGIQYCCQEYVNILKSKHISISMTENGDPLENAIAERVNGILKVEWIYDQRFKNLTQAQGYISQIIGIYNSERPHASIEMLTPNQAHQRAGELQRKWKNYYPQKVDVLGLISTD
jgi:transposase InsO family protein